MVTTITSFAYARIKTTWKKMVLNSAVIIGMTAEVDILTGKKTVLKFIMKPIFKAQQRALKER